MGTWTVFPEDTPPAPVRQLAERVEQDGGRVLALYQEPVGNHWQIFGLLPLEKVEPTPYQRTLSPAHVKRLAAVVKKTRRFVDPIVVTSPRPGVYWTPNGNHRRAVLAQLKAMLVPAILIPDRDVTFHILALNTEKAHTLKDKSLEVIRMYRELVVEDPSHGEEDYAFQFEAPSFITLGLLYETNARFAGGAFAPLLRRVDTFLRGTFPKTWPARQERADLVRKADEVLSDVVARLRRRGIRHPYVRNYVLARTTPLTRRRKTLPGFETTFTKLAENLAQFDVTAVRYEDIQRSALAAAPAPE